MFTFLSMLHEFHINKLAVPWGFPVWLKTIRKGLWLMRRENLLCLDLTGWTVLFDTSNSIQSRPVTQTPAGLQGRFPWLPRGGGGSVSPGCPISRSDNILVVGQSGMSAHVPINIPSPYPDAVVIVMVYFTIMMQYVTRITSDQPDPMLVQRLPLSANVGPALIKSCNHCCDHCWWS